MSVRILVGDCQERLRSLADESVNCVVTSPPYFGLRSYLPDDHPDKAREVGLEPTPDEFVAALVAVFREVRRVLRDDGTVWLNLGDSYAGSGRGGNVGDTSGLQGSSTEGQEECKRAHQRGSKLPAGLHERARQGGAVGRARVPAPKGLKQKDLIGIPWMVAFALRDDGWYLRSAIIWAKPNGMPGSQDDRPTSSYEFIFLLSKSRRYWSDFDAIKTPPRESTLMRLAQDVQAQAGSHRANGGGQDQRPDEGRSVRGGADRQTTRALAPARRIQRPVGRDEQGKAAVRAGNDPRRLVRAAGRVCRRALRRHAGRNRAALHRCRVSGGRRRA